MSGRHAVEHGKPSWSEQQQYASGLDLPASVLAGLAAARPVDLPDGHPSSPSLRRPAPYSLTVGQFVTWMTATHQAVWGRMCKCEAEDCVYLEAIMRLDPNKARQIARFMRWMQAGHQHMPNGCSCDVYGCEYRKRLDWVAPSSLAALTEGWASHPAGGTPNDPHPWARGDGRA